MKKNGWYLLLLVFLGLLGGSLVAKWLESVPGLDFLTKTYKIDWSPAADLLVVNYHIQIGLNISLLSLLGAAIGIWVYRRK